MQFLWELCSRAALSSNVQGVGGFILVSEEHMDVYYSYTSVSMFWLAEKSLSAACKYKGYMLVRKSVWSLACVPVYSGTYWYTLTCIWLCHIVQVRFALFESLGESV